MKQRMNGSSNRVFGFVFAFVFTIIGLAPLYSGEGVRIWSLSFAGVFTITALFFPVLLEPLNILWTRFGFFLHKIINPIVMGILFFGVVTPTGVCMRLFGKDLLKLKFEPGRASYWEEREKPGPDPETMKHQF